jgi:DNA/RNA-binding domain of Phe-tRNA-synthetase-like protein
MDAAPKPCSLAIDPAFEPGPAGLRAALVWGLGLPSRPGTEAPPAFIAELLGRVRAAGESFLPPERKAAVRDMLRFGKYKPAGRAKPSSEYLLAAALAGDFPLVNGPVDANNAVSLEWGYPASVFDLAKTGRALLVRRGRAGESYVFNPSGQSIDLEDLIVVCRRAPGEEVGEPGSPGSPVPWQPCGNPVKDAMATKVFEGARDVAAVVYAPASDGPDRLAACAERFRALLESECGAEASGYELVG